MGFYPSSGSQTVSGDLIVNGTITASGTISTTDLGTIIASGGLNAGVGSVDVPEAGAGLRVKEGTNCKQGTATMVSGSATVANTAVTANSRIILGYATPGSNVGIPFCSSITAGTGFTITSSTSDDDSTYSYEIFEPG